MLLVARIFIVVLRRFQPQAKRHPTTHIFYQVILTLFVSLFLCVSHSSLHFDFLFCSKLATPSSICPFFCPTVASNSYSSWNECPSNLWTLPNEFLQNDELSVDAIIKNCPKPCMFPLLLCLGTILAPTCPASCQPSCSPPPSSRSVGRHHFTPSATLRRPLRGFALRPLLLHHPSQVAG